MIWIISIWFNRGYSKNIKIKNLLKGISIGTVIILFIYALLPENLRFSRALILFGSISSLIITLFNRSVAHLINFLPHKFRRNKKIKIAIIGLQNEITRVKQIILNAQINTDTIESIAPSEETQSDYHIANLNQLNELIGIHKIDEIIFCAKNLPSNQIINTMFWLSDLNVNFKIAQPETFAIIGSNSIETAGELYTIEINLITKENNIRNKRVFDITLSTLLLTTSPLIFLFSKIPFKLINNSMNVLLGFKTWVGYSKKSNVSTNQLPKIKEGILTPLDLGSKKEISDSFIRHSNMVYAKNYTVLNDAKILLKGFKHIGR